ncbi:hypothetical protein PsorP6_010362 [Peronosclerospora sorghi]|uniref:Uncharacterized protein n=1 Tax=Peronosclerospora sorghi TaxID=230839 RepID=A0ACC0VWZ4_9STRA|nr:hypothetical protein PsorP6_010362 [Peronosclerospora sorghi]
MQTAANWDDDEKEDEPQIAAKTEVTTSKIFLKHKQIEKVKLKEIEEKQKMEIALTKARLAAQADETNDHRRAREKASIEKGDFRMAINDFFVGPSKPAAEATNMLWMEKYRSTRQCCVHAGMSDRILERRIRYRTSVMS